jgi:hypothetical protein
MFNENGLGDHGTDTTRPPESGKSNDNMDKKDNEIAHIGIVSRMANAMNVAQINNSPCTGDTWIRSRMRSSILGYPNAKFFAAFVPVADLPVQEGTKSKDLRMKEKVWIRRAEIASKLNQECVGYFLPFCVRFILRQCS